MPIENVGSFVPTSFSWEIGEIQQLDIDPQLKSLIVRLYQNLNLMALVLNTKDSALYTEQEFLNGQRFFPNPSLTSSTAQTPTQRQVFRKVINFGTLPNTATTSVAHGITIDANTSITRLYGAATDPSTSFIPLPFASPTALADNILLSMDATNINITTGSNRTGYTTCYVVIELIKQ